MSYDVCLTIDTGGENPANVSEYRCPTYNLDPMFRKALGFGLRDLQDRLADDIIPDLRRAIAAMQDRPTEFKQLNPENGWGTYEGALSFFQAFLQDCLSHPKATVNI